MVMKMLQDTRVIESIWLSARYDLNWTIGKSKVDKIEVYGEPSQGAFVPWFAIWIDGEVRVRVNAAKIESIVYAKEEEGDGDSDVVSR